MKWNRILAVLIASVMLTAAAGCGEEPAEPAVSVSTGPTVGDIFTQPTEADTQPAQTEPKKGSNVGAMSHGPKNVLRDETGTYLLYGGGEMRVTYGIHASGSAAEHGTGILLFVDGQPQPYKTAFDDTYRYMHVFYPEDGVGLVTELIFVPVTGQEGDALELWYSCVNDPEHDIEAVTTGFIYTFGSTKGGTTIRYEATPPEAEIPEIPDRAASVSISCVDLTAGETFGWTDTDWLESHEFHMYVNDRADAVGDLRIFEITEEEPVRLRFEVWGNPYVHYGLVFFVDNQPVSVDGEDLIFFGVSTGQKTVVQVELDMTGFDGTSVVYAALIPRNWRSAEVLTANWLDMTRTFFLLAGERE